MRPSSVLVRLGVLGVTFWKAEVAFCLREVGERVTKPSPLSCGVTASSPSLTFFLMIFSPRCSVSVRFDFCC